MNQPLNGKDAKISRRSLLKAAGVAGTAVVSGGLMGKWLVHHHSGGINMEVQTVTELLKVPRDTLQHGTVAKVAGYKVAGDGGTKTLMWNESSEKADNQGTIHDPSAGSLPGRWEVIHDGTGDFRWFGIFDETLSADDAFKAMIEDETIHRIEAHSNLLFQQRHVIHRSNIELDFNGYHLYTDGIAEAEENNPFAAVFYFRGIQTFTTQSVTLSDNMTELNDIFEVADSSLFQVGDWWRARVNHLDGREERELDKLMMVTEIIDATHVRFNYLIGWELRAGREVQYWKVEPVMRSHVRNMIFHGAGTTMKTGSHPIAYEFAVECDTTGIEGHGTFWPLIMRRHCTHYLIKQCKLYNPVEVLIGGSGYLAQQIHCLYGHVSDCYTSNARHLNDFTGSAYCMVENCHNSGDDLGAFVTHGQFEHDLVYVGNSGLMSFANSGPTWGESAKRITVKKHVGSRFIAHRKVTDLTLEDVQVYVKEGLEDSGTIWLNVDGIQMRHCTAPAGVTFLQVSSRSKRQNIVQGCAFHFSKDDIIVQSSVYADITMQDCSLYEMDGCYVNGEGQLMLMNTFIYGDVTAAPLRIANPQITITGGALYNTGITLLGTSDQMIQIGAGARISGTNAEKVLLKNDNNNGIVTWNLEHYTSDAATSSTAHIVVESGLNQYKAIGVTFKGGRLLLTSAGFANESYMLQTSCIEDHVERVSMPPSSNRIRYEENLILG